MLNLHIKASSLLPKQVIHVSLCRVLDWVRIFLSVRHMSCRILFPSQLMCLGKGPLLLLGHP